MDAFWIYLLCSIITLWGSIIFTWWWLKTGRATEVYRYVTVLLFAEFTEKSVLTIWRYQRMNELYYGDSLMIDAAWWPFISVPTTLAFFVLVLVMTTRIYRTYFAYTKDPEVFTTPRDANKSVLVISIVKETRNFMKAVFTNNGVKYKQASSFLNGLEMLVSEDDISVVMIGLSAISDSGLSQGDVIRMVKKERPWCIVVAMTRQPNIFELFESRRAFFDDYIHIPARTAFIMRSFERWIERINRWRHIDHSDRRKRDGQIRDRKNLKTRKTYNQMSRSEDLLQ